jgi:hypothetical protein
LFLLGQAAHLGDAVLVAEGTGVAPGEVDFAVMGVGRVGAGEAELAGLVRAVGSGVVVGGVVGAGVGEADEVAVAGVGLAVGAGSGLTSR